MFYFFWWPFHLRMMNTFNKDKKDGKINKNPESIIQADLQIGSNWVNE